ncbi:ABC transporter ATP-binding protein [Fictibacillus iocasae]|uniref:ABC transporter ATP-binding protein n=1 Tax=Fictibacillus iocasae TaxID=2715437 RepID=A0ABW2NUF5_9BACL
MSVLSVKNVTKTYNRSGKPALSHVSLTVQKGECVGIVGESGSGKSTLAKCVLGLYDTDLGMIDRPKKLQAVFQNPSSSLNPKLRIMDSVLEALEGQHHMNPSYLAKTGNDRRNIGEYLLDLVQLPGELLDRYPHQLSGGQKQRISIARAISIEPDLIVLDEPTASLDVSVQANVLNLFKDLQDEFSLSYLFISHDLAAVNFMSQQIGVMKDGELLEVFPQKKLFSEERHHYTKELLHVFRS